MMSRIQSGHVHKVTLSSANCVDNHEVLIEEHIRNLCMLLAFDLSVPSEL